MKMSINCGRMNVVMRDNYRNGTNRRIEFIEFLDSQKHILFGKSTSNNTFTHKQAVWEEAAQLARSLYLMPQDKHWSYARNTLWPNIKRRTMQKRQNYINSNSDGTKVKFDPLDQVVLRVLGLDNFEVGDSTVASSSPSPVQYPDCSEPSSVEQSVQDNSTCDERNLPDELRLEPSKEVTSFEGEFKSFLAEAHNHDELMKKLRVEMVQIEILKKKYELFEMEKRLNLKRSKYTIDLETYSDSE